MKSFRKIIALLLVLSLTLAFGVNTFAADPSTKSQEPKNIVVSDVIQNELQENEMQATTYELQDSERNNLWSSMLNNKGVSSLESKLSAEGFVPSDEFKDTAIKITDENSSLSINYFFRIVDNANGERVAIIYIYNFDSNNMLKIYAEKLNSSKDALTSYYNYSEENNIVSTRSGNSTVAFLCGLTGTIACGAFSAMLFAFVPASIAVGMTCGAAFDYVCSRG